MRYGFQFIGSSTLITTNSTNYVLMDYSNVNNASMNITNLVINNQTNCTIDLYYNGNLLKSIFLPAYQGWQKKAYEANMDKIIVKENGVILTYYGSTG